MHVEPGGRQLPLCLRKIEWFNSNWRCLHIPSFQFILEFYNDDLEQIYTLVKVDVLERFFIESEYDPVETEFLLLDFKEDFPLGMRETNASEEQLQISN